MRVVLVVVLSLFSVSSAALGQSIPYFATVVDSGAKLRAGASENYPDTATLRPGDRLLVDHEESNGWLAVQDAPGKLYSMSWVPMQYVNFDITKTLPQNVTVEEEATLAAGQIGIAQPLTYVRQSKVPAGTILTVIGQKVKYEGKSWYPVVPPAGDFRYITKKSVQAEKTANTSFTIRDSLPSPGSIPATPLAQNSNNIPPQPLATVPPMIGPPTLPVVGMPVGNAPVSGTPVQGQPPTPPKPIVQNPLWAQAEAAEQDNRLDDAEKLYFQLARQMNEPGGDHDIANLCYTRIHSLREKKKASGVTPRASGAPLTQAVNASVSTTPGQPVAVAASNPKPAPLGTGKLSRSALDIDGRKTYALESTPGVVVAYVVAGKGVDLERYAGRRVDVYGASGTRKDLSKPLIEATSAETIP
jgi:uncharacterized protein YgiM (DUF1202 family)